jgi:predicted  nucleic acid-binding Zn-ribbon protein
MRQRQLIVVQCIALFVLPLASWGQQQESREREALRRARQQLQSVQEENEALRREKAELEQKLKSAQSSTGSMSTEIKRLRKDSQALAAAEKDRSELRAKLGATETQLAQAGDRLRELQQKAETLDRQLESERAAAERSAGQARNRQAELQSALGAEALRTASCEEKNLQLYSVTADLISKYKQNRGAWEKFLLSEPFTGLKAVEVDNLLEDMRLKAAAAKVDAPRPQVQVDGPRPEPKVDR